MLSLSEALDRTLTTNCLRRYFGTRSVLRSWWAATTLLRLDHFGLFHPGGLAAASPLALRQSLEYQYGLLDLFSFGFQIRENLVDVHRSIIHKVDVLLCLGRESCREA